MAVATYGDYLTFIGQTSLDNEVQVKQALESAENSANEKCNRIFAKYDGTDAASKLLTTIEETFSGRGTRKYFPEQAPIVSVTKVEYWDTDVWTEFDTDSYTPVFTLDRVTFREGYLFPEGDDNLRLTYVYGYTEVPAALIRAICLIAQTGASVSTRDPHLKSQSDGEQSYTYFGSDKVTIPIEAEDLLLPFMRYPSG